MCVRVISPFPLGLEKRGAPAAGHAGDSSGFSAGPARAHGTMLVRLWFFARFQPGKWVTSGAGDPRSCFVAHSELRRWQAGVQITNSTGAETGARGQKQYIYIYIWLWKHISWRHAMAPFTGLVTFRCRGGGDMKGSQGCPKAASSGAQVLSWPTPANISSFPFSVLKMHFCDFATLVL